MTPSREKILQKIAAAKPAPLPLPEIPALVTVYDNKSDKFAETLAAIGGKAIRVSGFGEIRETLESLFGEATPRATTIPELSEWADFDLHVADPHLLERLEVAVIGGVFGVAENAAVWVPEKQTGGQTLPHRVLPFITQYLAIVISESSLVSNMHEAYQKIGDADTGWGAFIAGPSKTADIEQSLVIGAHGPRGAVVFLTP